MYTKFFGYFGLRTNPFHIITNSDFLFLNHRAQAALDSMAGAIRARKGLIVLTGEVGTGKTTLINELKQWLADERTPTAFIFNPYIEASDLFDLILEGFGVAVNASRREKPLDRLHRWLTEQYQADKNAVAILDEAQGLPVHLLLEISMLLNHEMEGEKLLQIVLSGEPELEETLKRPDLRQIRQRISLRCKTTAFAREEAYDYICQSLRVAGGNPEDVMAREAIDAIYLHSSGIPRVMNLLCEHSMMQAFMKQIKPVPSFLVDEVARQLQFDAVPVSDRSIQYLEPSAKSPAAWPRISSDSSRWVPFAPEERMSFHAPIPQVPEATERKTTGTAGPEFETVINSPLAPSLLPESRPKSAPPPTPILKFDSYYTLIQELQTGLKEAPVAATALQPDDSKEPEKISGARGWTRRRVSRGFSNQNLLRTFRGLWRGVRTRLNLLADGISEGLTHIPTQVKFPERKRTLALTVQRLDLPQWNEISRPTLGRLKSISTLAKLSAWQKDIDRVIRWLRQPVPFLKIHRRVGH